MSKLIAGAVIGLVESLDDPQNLGRVKVKFPHLDIESDWARIAAPMAGQDRGLFLRPEKGDEVLVVFLNGDRRFPFIVGALWNTVDIVPKEADDGKKTDNNLRVWKSRSGHFFRFDDTHGSEKIELVDKDGALKVVIDSSQHKIQVTCDQGDVEVSAKAGTVKVDALKIELKADTTITIEATGNLTLKGAVVNIN